MPTQAVFPSQIIHSRKVIRPLMRPHLLKKLNRYSPIKPCDIPILLIILSQMIVENRFSDLFNNIVLCERCIHYQPRFPRFISLIWWCRWVTKPLIIVIFITIILIAFLFLVIVLLNFLLCIFWIFNFIISLLIPSKVAVSHLLGLSIHL